MQSRAFQKMSLLSNSIEIPACYRPGFNSHIDHLLEELNFIADQNTTWQEVADALDLAGYSNEAALISLYTPSSVSSVPETDVLSQDLLQPRHFNMQIEIRLPDIQARKEILHSHITVPYLPENVGHIYIDSSSSEIPQFSSPFVKVARSINREDELLLVNFITRSTGISSSLLFKSEKKPIEAEQKIDLNDTKKNTFVTQTNS